MLLGARPLSSKVENPIWAKSVAVAKTICNDDETLKRAAKFEMKINIQQSHMTKWCCLFFFVILSLTLWLPYVAEPKFWQTWLTAIAGKQQSGRLSLAYVAYAQCTNKCQLRWHWLWTRAWQTVRDRTGMRDRAGAGRGAHLF